MWHAGALVTQSRIEAVPLQLKRDALSTDRQGSPSKWFFLCLLPTLLQSQIHSPFCSQRHLFEMQIVKVLIILHPHTSRLADLQRLPIAI